MIIAIDRSRPGRADIRRLSRVLRNHQAVVLPTETQYALAGDATSRRAIAAVRSIKGRGLTAPFSIFLTGIDDLARWRIECGVPARKLARAFWPGPLTLILPTANPLFKLLGGDGRSVGVRVTPEPIIAMLLKQLQAPLIATSANPSGVALDSRSENTWMESLATGGIITWARPRRYVRKPASTIVDCTGKVPRQIRPGPITKAEWNATLSRGV